MTPKTAGERLQWLTDAVSAGQIHTVRVSWSDRLGVWRGKRIPAEDFLGSPERRLGFCDGMIIVDVNCDIIQETPFSNFETGYPDMYVQPDLGTIGAVGWIPGEAFVLGTLQSHHHEPLDVAPRNVLEKVLGRLAGAGISLTARTVLAGRMMRSPSEPVALMPGGLARDEEPPGALRAAADGLLVSGVPLRFVDAREDGTFRVALGAQEPVPAGDAAVLTKAALKETAMMQGRNAVFMTKVPGSPATSELQVTLELAGAPMPDRARIQAALHDARGLLQPSITAFKAGPTVLAGAGQAIDLHAASEADPFTALAVSAAAIGVALDGDVELNGDGSPANLAAAADRLERTPWASDWLTTSFVENVAPLLRNESTLFDGAVTDWETARYWAQG